MQANSLPAFVHRINHEQTSIFWIPLSSYKFYFHKYTHPKEIEFVNNHINNPTRQTQFLATRSLLRYLHGSKEFYDLNPILSAASGVPFILENNSSENFYFCFSHTKQFIGLSYNKYFGTGFDIESTERDFLKIREKFLSEKEWNYLKELHKNQKQSTLSLQALLSIAFSFKESVFKAIFPKYQLRFYFEHCTIESINLEDHHIQASIHKAASGYHHGSIDGHFHWNQEDSFILTWVYLKPS